MSVLTGPREPQRLRKQNRSPPLFLPCQDVFSRPSGGMRSGHQKPQLHTKCPIHHNGLEASDARFADWTDDLLAWNSRPLLTIVQNGSWAFPEIFVVPLSLCLKNRNWTCSKIVFGVVRCIPCRIGNHHNGNHKGKHIQYLWQAKRAKRIYLKRIINNWISWPKQHIL